MTRQVHTHSPWEALLAVASVIAFVAFVALASGCSPSARQRVLNANATTVVQTQDAREAFYESQHGPCLEREDIAAYRECMLPSTIMARVVDTYDRTLRAAQAALNAADQDAFEAMIPDLIRVAAEVVRALRAAGTPVPDAVLSIASLAGGE